MDGDDGTLRREILAAIYLSSVCDRHRVPMTLLIRTSSDGASVCMFYQRCPDKRAQDNIYKSFLSYHYMAGAPRFLTATKQTIPLGIFLPNIPKLGFALSTVV